MRQLQYLDRSAVTTLVRALAEADFGGWSRRCVERALGGFDRPYTINEGDAGIIGVTFWTALAGAAPHDAPHDAPGAAPHDAFRDGLAGARAALGPATLFGVDRAAHGGDRRLWARWRAPETTLRLAGHGLAAQRPDFGGGVELTAWSTRAIEAEEHPRTGRGEAPTGWRVVRKDPSLRGIQLGFDRPIDGWDDLARRLGDCLADLALGCPVLGGEAFFILSASAGGGRYVQGVVDERLYLEASDHVADEYADRASSLPDLGWRPDGHDWVRTIEHPGDAAAAGAARLIVATMRALGVDGVDGLNLETWYADDDGNHTLDLVRLGRNGLLVAAG